MSVKLVYFYLFIYKKYCKENFYPRNINRISSKASVKKSEKSFQLSVFFMYDKTGFWRKSFPSLISYFTKMQIVPTVTTNQIFSPIFGIFLKYQNSSHPTVPYCYTVHCGKQNVSVFESSFDLDGFLRNSV
jgi:hypothetical protein